MNPALTFFRERSPDRVPPRRLPVQVAGRNLSLDFYAAGPPSELPEFFGRSFSQADDFQGFCEELRSALSERGGGLLVTTETKEAGLAVGIESIRPSDPSAYIPPGAAFSVDPGDELGEHSLRGAKTEISLPLGSHLILPVDAGAEARFRSFRTEYLAWFPRDFETLMLGVLRKPSLDLLDSRVARLERILLDIAEGKSRESRHLFAWFDRFRRESNGRERRNAGGAEASAENETRMDENSEAFRPSWKSLWFSVLVTGLLTAPAGYFAGRGPDKTQPEPGAQSSADGGAVPEVSTGRTAAPVETSPKVPPPPETEATADPASELAGSLDDLMALLSQESAPKPDAAVASLWDGHFKALPERGHLSRDAVEKLYARREFLWGMLKLPALLAQPESPKDKPGAKGFLGDPGRIAAEYKALLNPPSGLLAEPAIPPMLADLVCRLATVETKPDLLKISPFFDRGMKTEKIFSRQPCPPTPSASLPEQRGAIELMIEALRKRLAAAP